MHLQRLVRRLIFIFIFGGVLLYSAFALRNALRGPHITLTPIHSPITTSTVTLSGTVVRAEKVTINSLSVPLTTERVFALTTALIPGDNEFLIEASDRFGSTYKERIHLYHIPPAEPAAENTTETETPVIDKPE